MVFIFTVFIVMRTATIDPSSSIIISWAEERAIKEYLTMTNDVNNPVIFKQGLQLSSPFMS